MPDNTTRANMNHPSHSHDYINFKQSKNHQNKPYWNTLKNGTYVEEHDKFSKCTKFEDSNLKNYSMNAKNAEITNYRIMRIFNEVT